MSEIKRYRLVKGELSHFSQGDLCWYADYEFQMNLAGQELRKQRERRAELEQQLSEVRRSLNDLLNDCINFGGGKLSVFVMVQASKTLAALPPQEPTDE